MREQDAERGPRAAWHPEPELIEYRDREASREALEATGRAAWDAALDYLFDEAMRRPVGPETFPELRRILYGGSPGSASPSPPTAPDRPTPAGDVLEEFRRRLAPYQMNASNPRAFCYFTPPPLVLAVLGEMLAQVMNQGVDLWRTAPSATLVEEEVVGWLRDLVGYGEGSFGILTSGGVMANVMGLAVARDVGLARIPGGEGGPASGRPAGHLPILATPPRGGALEGVRVYASDQAHFSIERALDILGFPPGTLRLVPSDERFRLEAGPVAAAVAEDRAAGLRPLAIAAVAGSTNTGSIDALEDLAGLAAAERLWLHVDAAYGGAVRLSAREAHRVPALHLADSVTVDPHKWFFQPHDIGALLVRRRGDLLATFHREPEYYRRAGTDVRRDAGEASPRVPASHDPIGDPVQWYQYGIEGTRRFRGLKLWMSWKHLGTSGLGRLVEVTIDLAAHLARRIRDSDDFEALPDEPELSVVCFRHLPFGRRGTRQALAAGRLDPAELDAHQDALQRALEASGEGWVSTTRLRGSTWLRAGIVNYLSTEADVEAVLGALRRLGAQLPFAQRRAP